MEWDTSTTRYAAQRRGSTALRDSRHNQHSVSQPRGWNFRRCQRAFGHAAKKGRALGVAFADYDDDGFADIFVANDGMEQFLFHNNGNGTFTERGLEAGAA